MPRRSRRAVLGGTFDHFHRGHEELLSAGLSASGHLGVGVTTSRYLAAHPKPVPEAIESFARRRAAVRRFLAEHASPDRFTVAPLNDTWGRSVEPDIDLLVASADTHAGVRSVNEERRRRGLPSLPVRWVRLMVGKDLLPISSRRIRAGVIDREGERKIPLDIVVVSDRAEDRANVGSVWRQVLGEVSLRVDHRTTARGRATSSNHSSLRRIARELARRGVRDHEVAIGIVRGSLRNVAVSVWDASGEWKTPRLSDSRGRGVKQLVKDLLCARQQGRERNPHRPRK